MGAVIDVVLGCEVDVETVGVPAFAVLGVPELTVAVGPVVAVPTVDGACPAPTPPDVAVGVVPVAGMPVAVAAAVPADEAGPVFDLAVAGVLTVVVGEVGAVTLVPVRAEPTVLTPPD